MARPTDQALGLRPKPLRVLAIRLRSFAREFFRQRRHVWAPSFEIDCAVWKGGQYLGVATRRVQSCGRCGEWRSLASAMCPKRDAAAAVSNPLHSEDI